jgi:hypothetical protein
MQFDALECNASGFELSAPRLEDTEVIAALGAGESP